ncbi:MAG: transcriptional regulator MntR [Phycisphaerae bacterium]|nr:transcriptional regulator MntR [Phycisphaerae bacterium]|tara:strand:- start:25 stop:438 length:414 start_codon:yes stop_codon:yes gene_type:complete
MSSRANQFAKTRTDHASETAEDYVEAIEDILTAQPSCRVKDLSERMDVSHVTVTRILQRLTNEGLVAKEPYGPVSLTPIGKRMAKASRRRHELLLEFLLALGVPEADAVRDTEGMEHHVSESTLKCMRRYLDTHNGG